MVTINIGRKETFFFVGFIAVLMGIGIVIAYTNIPNPGHGADETVIDIGGIEKTLQQAYDAWDLGGRGLYWESTGITFNASTKGVFSFESHDLGVAPSRWEIFWKMMDPSGGDNGYTNGDIISGDSVKGSRAWPNNPGNPSITFSSTNMLVIMPHSPPIAMASNDHNGGMNDGFEFADGKWEMFVRAWA
jgi:hypothetical protein